MDFLNKIFGIKYRSGIYYNPRTNRTAILSRNLTTFSIEFKHYTLLDVRWEESGMLSGYEYIGKL